MCLFSTIIFDPLFCAKMFAKLVDEFGILDVIVVDDYWNRKVLYMV